MKNHWLEQSKCVRVTSIVCVANVANKNNRIYSSEVLEEVVVQFNNCKSVVLGELWPTDGSSIKIKLSNVSHSVCDLRLEGGELIADIITLNTPLGSVLSRMIKDGLVAFRLRGVGNVDFDGDGRWHIKDYDFISVDAMPKDIAS